MAIPGLLGVMLLLSWLVAVFPDRVAVRAPFLPGVRQSSEPPGRALPAHARRSLDIAARRPEASNLPGNIRIGLPDERGSGEGTSDPVPTGVPPPPLPPLPPDSGSAPAPSIVIAEGDQLPAASARPPLAATSPLVPPANVVSGMLAAAPVPLASPPPQTGGTTGEPAFESRPRGAAGSLIPGAPPPGSLSAQTVAFQGGVNRDAGVGLLGSQPSRSVEGAFTVEEPLSRQPAAISEPLRGKGASLRAAIVDVETGTPAARTTRRSISSDGDAREGRARGFVVDGQGYIVTSASVVGNRVNLDVTLHDGRGLAAVLVAEDRLNDIAILRVEATGLTAIALGDSHVLVAGAHVLAIGRGPDAGDALTEATIRATGSATGANLAVDLEASSAGAGVPLLNRFGQAVGMVTGSPGLAEEATPLTYAVPIDRVKPLLRRLKSASGPTTALAPR